MITVRSVVSPGDTKSLRRRLAFRLLRSLFTACCLVAVDSRSTSQLPIRIFRACSSCTCFSKDAEQPHKTVGGSAEDLRCPDAPFASFRVALRCARGRVDARPRKRHHGSRARASRAPHGCEGVRALRRPSAVAHPFRLLRARLSRQAPGLDKPASCCWVPGSAAHLLGGFTSSRRLGRTRHVWCLARGRFLGQVFRSRSFTLEPGIVRRLAGISSD